MAADACAGPAGYTTVISMTGKKRVCKQCLPPAIDSLNFKRRTHARTLAATACRDGLEVSVVLLLSIAVYLPINSHCNNISVTGRQCQPWRPPRIFCVTSGRASALYESE